MPERLLRANECVSVIAEMNCAGAGECKRLRGGGTGRSVGDFGEERACGSSDGKPFGGAGNAAEKTAAIRCFQSGVALAGERGGLGLFVGEIGLRGGEPSLASFAVESEIVERLEVLLGKDDLGAGAGLRRRVLRRGKNGGRLWIRAGRERGGRI